MKRKRRFQHEVKDIIFGRADHALWSGAVRWHAGVAEPTAAAEPTAGAEEAPATGGEAASLASRLPIDTSEAHGFFSRSWRPNTKRCRAPSPKSIPPYEATTER
jgi:hypothetical protein